MYVQAEEKGKERKEGIVTPGTLGAFLYLLPLLVML